MYDVFYNIPWYCFIHLNKIIKKYELKVNEIYDFFFKEMNLNR